MKTAQNKKQTVKKSDELLTLKPVVLSGELAGWEVGGNIAPFFNATAEMLEMDIEEFILMAVKKYLASDEASEIHCNYVNRILKDFSN